MTGYFIFMDGTVFKVCGMFCFRRERVSLNPVKSRLCQVPGLGKDSLKIGYIKLTTFNENASGEYKSIPFTVDYQILN